MTISHLSPEDGLLRPREVAEILGVRTTTVARWARQGLLEAVTTPGGHRRYRRSDVIAFQNTLPSDSAAQQRLEQDAMRMYLKGDGPGYKRIADRLDPAAKKAHAALIVASFLTATDERFGRDATRADVAEFVENLRGRSEQLANDIDPRQAERLIIAVHTDEDISDIDNGLYGPLLAGMIADARLSDVELDEFLEKARILADQMLDS